jgi:urease accessory protein
LVQPSFVNPYSIGQLEGYTHQASLILLNEKINCAELKDQVYNYLLLQEGISFGVSNAPVNGIVVRILGNKAEQLFKQLQSITKLSSVKIASAENNMV